jgi:hypothetical protein
MRIDSTLAVFGRLSESQQMNGIEFRIAESSEWFHEQTFDVDTSGDEVVVKYRWFQTLFIPLAKFTPARGCGHGSTQETGR